MSEGKRCVRFPKQLLTFGDFAKKYIKKLFPTKTIVKGFYIFSSFPVYIYLSPDKTSKTNRSIKTRGDMEKGGNDNNKCRPTWLQSPGASHSSLSVDEPANC